MASAQRCRDRCEMHMAVVYRWSSAPVARAAMSRRVRGVCVTVRLEHQPGQGVCSGAVGGPRWSFALLEFLKGWQGEELQGFLLEQGQEGTDRVLLWFPSLVLLGKLQSPLIVAKDSFLGPNRFQQFCAGFVDLVFGSPFGSIRLRQSTYLHAVPDIFLR